MDFFKIIIRDFQEHKNKAQRQIDTNMLFKSYDNLETAIRQLYRNPNEEREVARKLNLLKQIGSIAEYLSKFQQITSKIY